MAVRPLTVLKVRFGQATPRLAIHREWTRAYGYQASGFDH